MPPGPAPGRALLPGLALAPITGRLSLGQRAPPPFLLQVLISNYPVRVHRPDLTRPAEGIPQMNTLYNRLSCFCSLLIWKYFHIKTTHLVRLGMNFCMGWCVGFPLDTKPLKFLVLLVSFVVSLCMCVFKSPSLFLSESSVTFCLVFGRRPRP